MHTHGPQSQPFTPGVTSADKPAVHWSLTHVLCPREGNLTQDLLGSPACSLCQMRQGQGEREEGGEEAAKMGHVRWNIVNNSNYISGGMNYSYLVNSHYISYDSNSYELMS